jgi:hypothetical protein
MYVREVTFGGFTEVRFQLPTGITLNAVREALPTIRTITGCRFIEMEAARSTVVLRVAERKPAPPILDAPTDTTSEHVPFAVNVDGDLIELTVASAPNLIVYGSPGSGKSRALHTMIAGYQARGGSVWAVATELDLRRFEIGETGRSASTVDDALVLLQYLSDEISYREALNTDKAVLRSTELPDTVAVTPILLIIDGLPQLTCQQSTFNRGRTSEVLAEIRSLLKIIAHGSDLVSVRVVVSTSTIGRDKFIEPLRSESANLIIGSSTVSERAAVLRHPQNSPELTDDEFSPRLAVWEPMDADRSTVVRFLG